MFSTFGDLSPCILPTPPPEARIITASAVAASEINSGAVTSEIIASILQERLAKMYFEIASGSSPADFLGDATDPDGALVPLPSRAPLPAPRILPVFPATALRAWNGFR